MEEKKDLKAEDRKDANENGAEYVSSMSPEMKEILINLANEHGTPLFVIDHAKIRENYKEFKKHLPRVQAYFAV